MDFMKAAESALKVVNLISDVVDVVDKNKGTAEEIKNYLQGKGPRPTVLLQLPDITKNELEHIRIQALAASKP